MNPRRVTLTLFAIATAGLLSLLAVDPRVAQADTTDGLPAWVDVQPEIKKQKDLNSEEFQARSINPQCEYQEVHEWGYNPGWGSKLKYTMQGCLVPMASGQFDVGNKGIVTYDSDWLQRLKDPLGTDMRQIVIVPAPNTNTLAMVYDASYPFSNGGAKLKLVGNWTQAFPASVTQDGYANIQRVRTVPYDYELKDQNGNYVEIRTQGLIFSPNGEWLQVLLRNKAHALLNTTTHELIPYSGSQESYWGLHGAVSNDGRYVAITHQLDSLKIYDVSQCDPASGEFVSRNCRSIELFDRIKSFIGSDAQVSIGNVEFVGVGDAIDVDTQSSVDGVSWRSATLRLSIPGSLPMKYLALGDSFSSGEGAFDYVEATDMFVSADEYNVCHVSRKSYPYLLQQKLQADWFHSVACSGSESKDVIFGGDLGTYLLRSSRAKIKVPGNVLNVEAYLKTEVPYYSDNMRPGYVPQNDFVVKHNPSMVTISMGGNDVGFEGMIRSCIFSGFTIIQTCFSSREERESKANEIDQKISQWSQNFVDIKNSLGGSDPKLYVIGYPKIVSPDLSSRCGRNVPFDDGERIVTDRMIDYLNSAVKVAADAAGVRYVDVSDAFMRAGEERLCSSGPVFAANGLDLWSLLNECTSATAPDAPACPNSFHPNERGHKLLAETITLRTMNLSQDMPQNSNSMADLIDKRMAFVGDVAITLQNHRITFQKDIAPALIAKGEKIQINLPKSSDELPAKSGTLATVTVHSTPRVLGQLAIAADGTISGEVTLPADIETGYHRLIISYPDLADNIVEKYMYFYAAQSKTDWDGDGVDNTSDPCVSTIQSNTDQDEDGIDDACDGEYVKSTPPAASSSDGDSTSAGASQGSVLSSKQQKQPNINSAVSNDSPIEFVADSGNIFNAPTTTSPLVTVGQDDGVASKNRDSEQNLAKYDNPLVWLSAGGGLVVGILAIIGFILGWRQKS